MSWWPRGKNPLLRPEARLLRVIERERHDGIDRDGAVRMSDQFRYWNYTAHLDTAAYTVHACGQSFSTLFWRGGNCRQKPSEILRIDIVKRITTFLIW